MTDTTGDEGFPEEFETDPPVPVEARGTIAHGADDVSAIPDGLIPTEHEAKIDGWWVVRAGVDCPKCGSNVFFHPRSIVPHNTVECFNCRFWCLSYAWWDQTALSDFQTGGSA